MSFVKDLNTVGRRLTPSQIALAFSKMEPYETRLAKERQLTGKAPDLGMVPSQRFEARRVKEILAAKSGIGQTTIQHAINIKRTGRLP